MSFNMTARLLLLSISLGLSAVAQAKPMVWAEHGVPVTYTLRQKPALVVSTALKMFSGDMSRIIGSKTQAAKDGKIQIVQLDCASSSVRKWLRSQGVNTESIVSKADGFHIEVLSNGRIVIVGADARGTAYGILELSRLAGVSPWTWWNGYREQQRQCLSIDDKFQTTQTPSVKYRGIFINDEDWTFQPWSWQTFEPGNPRGMIGHKTYRQVFELLLRLRANTIWPAMHESSIAFYKTPRARAEADSCGIVVGTSHCDALMRNNVGEWDYSLRGQYNYVTNSAQVKDFWAERLRETAKQQNIYTIGMRGIHDGSMEGVHTMEEKVTWLQRVIDDQRQLLSRYVNKDLSRVPQAFVPYKEVLTIMENGLKVPDDVTLMWCDDNYGYITRLSSPEQQKRSGGAGVYYHLSYWGRPHDYLWLCTTQPGLIYAEMNRAYNTGARQEWIANVHDIKTASYDMELFLDMAWNEQCVSANSIEAHLLGWLCREFGAEAGKRLLPVMREYYRLCDIRKPEFMGWSQVELDRNVYPRGRSDVRDTEFSPTAFGGELQRYLADFQRISDEVQAIRQTIAPQKRDAYFSHIEYRVRAASAMAAKMLNAQMARSLYLGQADESLWTRDSLVRLYSEASQAAYNEIKALTHYYNNTMDGGRWRGSMTYQPRDLYVFWPPKLPIAVTADSTELAQSWARLKTVTPVTNDSHACDYQQSQAAALNASSFARKQGKAEPIQMLGHSLSATHMGKGSVLEYDIPLKANGECLLTVALLPTHSACGKGVRVAVSIDGGEWQERDIEQKDRTPQWKANVLRGQVLLKFPVKLNGADSSHTVRIKAVDDNVIADQLILDANPRRSYYVIPASSTNNR
jgi:hypothetical protein